MSVNGLGPSTQPPQTVTTTNTQQANNAVVNNTPNADPPQPGGSGGTPKLGAGEVSVPSATLTSIDWSALVDDFMGANVSVSVTAILTMLMEIMAEMRQEGRTAALDYAQTSTELAADAAAKMKSAAIKQLVVTGVNSGISAGFAAAALGKTKLEAPDAKTLNMDTKGMSPEALSAHKLKVDTITSNMQNTAARANAVSTIATSTAQALTAPLTMLAAFDTADAEVLRSLASYAQSLQQNEQDFFRQLGDAISAAIATMKAANQAQHEASQAIYNM